MKKLSLIAMFVVFAFSMHAQLFNIGSVGIGYVYVGPKLGTNAGFSSVDASAGAEKKMNLGYQFGAVGKLGITEKIAIQGELVYTSKGYKQKGTDQFMGDYKDVHNYNYIGLPIIGQFSFISIGDFDFYGSGGFYTNVMTGGKATTKYTDVGETFEVEVDFNLYKRTDFGLSIGGGTTFPVNDTDRLNIDLRYTLGITNISDDNNASANRNRTFEISAIYFVDLTRWVSFRGKSKSNDAYDKKAPVGGSKVE